MAPQLAALRRKFNFKISDSGDLKQLLTSELEKFDINFEDVIKIHDEIFDVKAEKNLLTDSKHRLISFMFSWLNLPENDRMESSLQIALMKNLNECKKDENSNDVNSNTIPSLTKLLENLGNELKVSKIDVLDIIKKVTNDLYFWKTCIHISK